MLAKLLSKNAHLNSVKPNDGQINNAMLTVENLTVQHGSKVILKEINFSLNAGQCLVILGANGAGKSSLVHTLCGLLPYQYGNILVRDQALNSLSVQQVAQHIALVPQQQTMAFEFTALEMVVMGCSPFLPPFASPSAQDHQQALQVLKQVRAEALAARSYRDLSGGEKQLVLLARALLQARDLLVFDEPTNHLDYHNQYKILQTVKQVSKARNLTVILIMHDPNLAQLVADQVLMLADHSVFAYGAVDQIMTKQNISALYQMPTESHQFGDKTWFIPQGI